MKYLILLSLAVILTGCSSLNPLSGSFWGSDIGTGSDFLADNDAVFDLFQDDFGTGTAYDDRFIASGDGDLFVGETGTSADGEISYGAQPSLTFDPKYDEIGAMTPTELHEEQVLEIPVLVLGNNLFPFPDKQFGDKRPIDKCKYTHYHGGSGYTLKRQNISEPDDPCGFGAATKIISVSGDEMIEWFHNRPRNF